MAFKTIARTLLQQLGKSGTIYRASRKIVDYHDNLNNCELETNGEWSFIQRNIAEFGTVFDVGANVGEWSLLVNRLKPEAKVYAFEPVSSTFDLLKKQPFNENVLPQNCGLGLEAGTTEFFVYGDDSTLNTAHNRSADDLSGAKSETVKIDTLDDFCAKQGITGIDFLKIDTEGHELAVLKGGEGLLSGKSVKVLQFEYGGTYIDARILLKDVFEYLNSFGYEIYKIYPDRLERIADYSPALENFQYSNYIAAAPGFKVQ